MFFLKRHNCMNLSLVCMYYMSYINLTSQSILRFLCSLSLSVWSINCLTSHMHAHAHVLALRTEVVRDTVWSGLLRGSGHFNPFHMTVIRQDAHNASRSLTHTLALSLSLSPFHTPWLSTFHTCINKQLN